MTPFSLLKVEYKLVPPLERAVLQTRTLRR